MMLPAVILLFIFGIIPIVGYVIAFERYNPMASFFGLTSKWVGLQNFRQIFLMNPQSLQVIINTLIIAIAKIITYMTVPIIFALLLNEVFNRFLKRFIQTVVYLPYFLSWVIASAMFRQIFASTGLVNMALVSLGLLKEPFQFMASNVWFRPIIIFTDSWKSFGYNAVIYIAAITALDPNLYEAAEIDGANRWQAMRHVTLPGIMPTVILLGTLALGGILNAGFDQIYTMYNPIVYQTGDVLDTYVYRIGLVQMKFQLATAVGLAKSVISMILIILSYRLADRFAGYKIF